MPESPAEVELNSRVLEQSRRKGASSVEGRPKPYYCLVRGLTVNPYRYASGRLDRETRYHHLNHRYYDGRIGRVLSQDTRVGDVKTPLSLNRYIYGLNNPVNYLDPTGQIPIWLVVAILAAGALIGGVAAYNRSQGDPLATAWGALKGALVAAALLVGAYALYTVLAPNWR